MPCFVAIVGSMLTCESFWNLFFTWGPQRAEEHEGRAWCLVWELVSAYRNPLMEWCRLSGMGGPRLGYLGEPHLGMELETLWP